MSDAEYIKGACVHCNGRISFPNGALGSTIACPHCSKPTPLTDPNAAPSDTVKSTCGNCNGRISFPAAAAGSTIACPHCGTPTVLGGAAPAAAQAAAPAASPAPAPAPGSPPAPAAHAPQSQIYKARIPSAKPGKNGKLIALVSVGVVALITICVLLTLLFVKKGGGGDGGGGGGGGSGLELVSHTLQKASEGGLIYVVGVVTNHDPEQYFNVKVEFDLFDADGQPLGDTSDYNGNLAPQKSWEFRALVLEENASSEKPKPGGGVSGEKGSETQ